MSSNILDNILSATISLGAACLSISGSLFFYSGYKLNNQKMSGKYIFTRLRDLDQYDCLCRRFENDNEVPSDDSNTTRLFEN